MPSDSRAKKWPQSIWLQPDGDVSKPYLLLAGMTLLASAYYFTLSSNLIQSFIFVLVPGLVISYLVKCVLWQSELLGLCCHVLREVSRQQCRCEHGPEGYECIACYAKGVLREHFPDKLIGGSTHG